MKAVSVYFFKSVIFAVSMILVFIGQKNSGAWGIPMMLFGLSGLIFLLWLYNRSYR